MIKILLLTFIFSHLAFSSCKINLYPHILKLRPTLDESIIKKTNCSSEVVQAFISFISQFETTIKSSHAQVAFNAEIKTSVNISPRIIYISQLKELVSQELEMPQMIISDLSVISKNSSLNTEAALISQVICHNCNKVGQKSFKLKTQNESLWITANFSERIFAILSNTALSSNNAKLSSDQFTKKEVSYSGQSQLFSDFENIEFYKVMRPIKANQPITTFDLSPKILVEANKLVDVIFKSDSIELKGKALSRQSGRLGQNIELYNPKTKKIINATTINYNKVMVNL